MEFSIQKSWVEEEEEAPAGLKKASPKQNLSSYLAARGRTRRHERRDHGESRGES